MTLSHTADTTGHQSCRGNKDMPDIEDIEDMPDMCSHNHKMISMEH